MRSISRWFPTCIKQAGHIYKGFAFTAKIAVFTRWVGSGAKPGMCSPNANEAFAFNPASLYFILLQCDSLLALMRIFCRSFVAIQLVFLQPHVRCLAPASGFPPGRPYLQRICIYCENGSIH